MACASPGRSREPQGGEGGHVTGLKVPELGVARGQVTERPVHCKVWA